MSIDADPGPPGVQPTFSEVVVPSNPPYLQVIVAAALVRLGDAIGSLCGQAIDPAITPSGRIFADGWTSIQPL